MISRFGLGILVAIAALLQPFSAGTAESSYITINGAQLHVQVEGAGRPVVLLHGGYMDSTMWDALATELAESRQVIRFDFRGFGRSPRSSREYRPTDDIAGLLDHLGIPSAAVVGLSMGGAIAIDFALSHPRRTDLLVLGEPGLHGHAWSAEIMETMDAVDAAAREGGREAAIAILMDHPVFASAKDKPAAYGTIRAQLLRNFTLDDSRMLRAQPPAAQRLAKLRIPVLVLLSEAAGPDARAISGKIRDEVAGAKIVVVSGSGHMMNLEQPETFNRIVMDFLDAHAAASGHGAADDS